MTFPNRAYVWMKWTQSPYTNIRMIPSNHLHDLETQSPISLLFIPIRREKQQREVNLDTKFTNKGE